MRQENEILVKVEGVSKVFCRDLKKSLIYGLQDSIHDLFFLGKPSRKSLPRHPESSDSDPAISPGSGSTRLALREKEFLALDDVSFELRRGECLALIGRNGAGKTTLLKLLTGLNKPDQGRIEMRGRIGALIALGAGFNTILTGRENIYINGSILGFSRAEIDAKIEEIIEFSEIGDFIDSPVQSYSSGMQVKLGFAIATAADPDVLILDEVLAVGDAKFAVKCMNRIQTMRSNACTIMVSHHAENLRRSCNLGLVLDKGKIAYMGDLEKSLAAYNALGSDTDFEANHHSIKLEKTQYRKLENSLIEIETKLISNQQHRDIKYRYVIYDGEANKVAEWRSENHTNECHIESGSNLLACRFSAKYFKAGCYYIDFAVEKCEVGVLIAAKKNVCQIEIAGDKKGFATIQL